MNEYKSIIALITIAIAIVSYVPYFRDMLSGRTKPHAFTWLIWAILNGVAFGGQLYDKGGAGAWPLGFTAVVTFVIFFLALKNGEKNIKLFDWLCLGAAMLALIPWFLADSPLLSIIIVTIIDLIGFLPTVRKVYRKPYEETLSTHILSTLKYGLILVALETYTILTTLFPLVIFIADGLLVVLIIIRRQRKPESVSS